MAGTAEAFLPPRAPLARSTPWVLLPLAPEEANLGTWRAPAAYFLLPLPLPLVMTGWWLELGVSECISGRRCTAPLLLLLALDDATPAAAAALGWLAEGLAEAEAAAATGEAEEEEAPKSPKVMSRLTIPSRSTPSTTTLDAAPAHDDDGLAGCCWKAPKENGTWKASLSVSSSGGATMTCPPR